MYLLLSLVNCGIQLGEVINTGNITAMALADNLIIKASTIMPYEEYVLDHPPIYQRHVSTFSLVIIPITMHRLISLLLNVTAISGCP